MKNNIYRIWRKKMKKDMRYFDLLQACTEPGCPVCRLSLKATRHYMDNLMYEHVNDPGVRKNLREARGFCNEHAWWLSEDYIDALGIAIIHQDVIGNVLKIINVPLPGRKANQKAQNLLERLHPSIECPACTFHHTMEDIVIHTLLEYISDKEMSKALSNSAGLCLPHFSRALELVQENNTLKRLVNLERNILSKLHDELGEFIRKNDYQFIDESLGKESDSWLRALGIVSGERSIK